MWGRGVERDESSSLELDDLVELRPDVAVVLPHGIRDAFPHPVERHVMVSRDRNPREPGQIIDEFAGTLELLGSGPLCEIAADDDGVRAERGRDTQQGITDLGKVGWPEVQVRDMQQRKHGCCRLDTMISADRSG